MWAPAVHHRRQLINHYQPVSAKCGGSKTNGPKKACGTRTHAVPSTACLPQTSRKPLRPHAPRSEPRLDFSYFEHTDFSRFVEEYANTLDFVRDYKARTGFQPNGVRSRAAGAALGPLRMPTNACAPLRGLCCEGLHAAAAQALRAHAAAAARPAQTHIRNLPQQLAPRSQRWPRTLSTAPVAALPAAITT
jgi:hypothetical protein